LGEEFADVVQAGLIVGHAVIETDTSRAFVKLVSRALFGLARGRPSSTPSVIPCGCGGDALRSACLVSRRGDDWRIPVTVCLRHRRIQAPSSQ